jgi:hypothetical protein
MEEYFQTNPERDISILKMNLDRIKYNSKYYDKRHINQVENEHDGIKNQTISKCKNNTIFEKKVLMASVVRRFRDKNNSLNKQSTSDISVVSDKTFNSINDYYNIGEDSML